jgi:type II secretory pathway pseudopilin PulG
MRPIYIVDIVVVSLLLYLIVSSMMASKHYLDESMGKGLIEKLQHMLRSLVELLLSIVLTLILAVYICARMYMSDD